RGDKEDRPERSQKTLDETDVGKSFGLGIHGRVSFGEEFERCGIQTLLSGLCYATFKAFHVTIIRMKSFVQIVVNVPAVSGIFDYALPESLAGKIGVGHLVIVPFGKQTVQGVVFRFIDQPSVPEVKEVLELVDEEPVLTQPQIALAEAMAESTLNPLTAI